MAAAVITVTPVSTAKPYVEGNRNVAFFDITADTGDYAAGGFTLTASQFGLRRIDIVELGSGAATQGTDGASAVPLGVTYPSATSVKFQLYETGGSSGAPLSEKGAEAYAANFTFRVKVTGLR